MSMTFDQTISRSPGDYRFAWAVAFVLAVLSAPFIVIYKENAPWLIVVPLLLGTIVIVIYEFKAAFRSNSGVELLITLPSGFIG